MEVNHAASQGLQSERDSVEHPGDDPVRTSEETSGGGGALDRTADKAEAARDASSKGPKVVLTDYQKQKMAEGRRRAAAEKRAKAARRLARAVRDENEKTKVSVSTGIALHGVTCSCGKPMEAHPTYRPQKIEDVRGNGMRFKFVCRRCHKLFNVNAIEQQGITI